jgi:hypothetical protein
MLMTFGRISSRLSALYRDFWSNSEYFYPMFKAIRRSFAALTMTVLAFRAVASFLSWVEHQDESVADTWVDEDEFEDA